MESNNEILTAEEIQELKKTIDKITKIAIELISEVWNALEPVCKSIVTWLQETTFTEEEFLELIKDLGYTENEAKKIAWYYHVKYDKYTLEHYVIEMTKKEEEKNVAKS